MLTVNAINNNKNSVRVYDHSTNYSKSDLLAYADHIRNTKYARVAPCFGRAITTYAIKNGAAAIKHKTPEKKRHKIFVDRDIDSSGLGYSIEIAESDYFDNIIVFGNSDFNTRNVSEYADIFNNIVREIEYNDSYIDTVNAIKNGETEYYNNLSETDALKENAADIFGVDPDTITEDNCIKIYNVLQAFYNSRAITERETIAAILSELTPHKWQWGTIRGYCQGDWNYIVYPAALYSDNDIEYFECFYFGKYYDYSITYRGDTVGAFIPDYIAWNENEFNDYVLDILGVISCSASDIVYKFND